MNADNILENATIAGYKINHKKVLKKKMVGELWFF